MSYSLSESNSKKRVQFDFNVEGLRGLLSVMVGLSHVFGIKNILDPAYHPNAYWLNVGHSAVLIFFVMSGYVIGLTNQETYSTLKAKQYLLRRGIRLIPIYLIGVFIGVLVRTENIFNFIGNIFFLQNIFVTAIAGNSPVWSLNYEVIYYLIFIPIWWQNIRISFICLFCVSLSILGFFSLPIIQIISSYASGLIFWLFGFWLANRTEPNSNLSQVPLLYYLFLFYALHNFSFGEVILYGLGINGSSIAQVSFANIITTLPISIVIISVVTRRAFPALRWINLLCFCLPLLMIIFLLATGRVFEQRWIPSVIFYCLAVGALKFKFDLNLLALFSPLGRISYGFYLMHFPILFLVHDYFPYSGSTETFCLRMLVWLFLSITVSVLVELFMQPAIKIWFSQRWLAKSES